MLQLRQEKITTVRDICILDKITWYIIQDKYGIFVYFISVNLIHSYSYSLIYTRYIALKQWYIPHINTNFPVIIPTYSRILNTIEKAL